MKHISFIISFSFLIFQSPIVLGQTSGVKEQSYNKVDSLFNSLYQDNRPGASIAIIEEGKITYKNHRGLANLEYSLPITDSTSFHIASVSKQFTTYLALLLEEEGKLHFEDDIRNYLPELNHLTNKITIKDLTNHTHGLPNIHELVMLNCPLSKTYMNHQEVVEFLLNIQQPNFNVNDKYEYNNTGYILLAEIIKRVGGMPFKEQLKQKILVPLDMLNTQAIDESKIVVKNKAYSYQLVNGKYINYPLSVSTVGSSGINTTINDLSKWVKNYQKPVIGSKEFYQKMEQATYLTSGKKMEYGLGLQSGTYKGLNIIFHGGGDVGYRSYILHIPKHQMSIIILANTNDFSPLDMVYQTIDILLDDFIIKDAARKVRLDSKTLNAYVGTYEFYPGNYFNIIVENDSLYFQPYGFTEKNRLPELNANTFDYPYIPHTKLVFYKDRFDFHIADFTYECYKTTLPKKRIDEITLENYTGIFKNDEFNIIHEIVVKENKLLLKRAFDVIELEPLEYNSFYSRNLGRLDFVFDKNGKVTSFNFSGRNIKNIVFNK